MVTPAIKISISELKEMLEKYEKEGFKDVVIIAGDYVNDGDAFSSVMNMYGVSREEDGEEYLMGENGDEDVTVWGTLGEAENALNRIEAEGVAATLLLKL